MGDALTFKWRGRKDFAEVQKRGEGMEPWCRIENMTREKGYQVGMHGDLCSETHKPKNLGKVLLLSRGPIPGQVQAHTQGYVAGEEKWTFKN